MTTTPIHSSHDRLVVCLDGEITPHGAREFVLAVDQRLERYFCEHLEVVVRLPRRLPGRARAHGAGVCALARRRGGRSRVGHRQGAQRECNGPSAHDRPSAVGGTAPNARGGCGASGAAISCRFRRSECRPGRQRRAARLETTVRRRCATTRNHTGDGPKIGPGRPRLGGRSWTGLRPRASSAPAAPSPPQSPPSASCGVAAPRAARQRSPRGAMPPQNADKERAPAERENRSPPTMR